MDHTSKQFDNELADLKTLLLRMGAVVELQLSRALQAVERADASLIQSVVRDDRVVNELQMSIDRKTMETIAKRQPAAIDLRQTLCTLQAAGDLERIGDEVKKIAMRAEQFQTSEKFKVLSLNEVKFMGGLAQSMLKDVLNAFDEANITVATDVISRDQAVDREYSRIMKLIASYMAEDPLTVGAGLDIAFLAKSIERVADHAQNIGEYVIHIVQGDDPRHSTAERQFI